MNINITRTMIIEPNILYLPPAEYELPSMDSFEPVQSSRIQITKTCFLKTRFKFKFTFPSRSSKWSFSKIYRKIIRHACSQSDLRVQPIAILTVKPLQQKGRF
jgi:hypothetical protein